MNVDYPDGGHRQVLPPDELVCRERKTVPLDRFIRNRKIRLHQGSSQPEVGQRQVRFRHAVLHQQHDPDSNPGHHHEQTGQEAKR